MANNNYVKTIDIDGNKYTVVIYQKMIPSGTIGGEPGAMIKGNKSLKLQDGRRVNYISNGKYLIVESDTELTEIK